MRNYPLGDRQKELLTFIGTQPWQSNRQTARALSDPPELVVQPGHVTKSLTVLAARGLISRIGPAPKLTPAGKRILKEIAAAG